MLEDRSAAWFAVVNALNATSPGFLLVPDLSGQDCAVLAIQKLGQDRKQLAEERGKRLEAEFNVRHGSFFVDDRCMECLEANLSVDDPRHTWTSEQWIEEGRKA